jgi:transposase
MLLNNSLIVGVDVHRRTNVVQVMDGQGQVLTTSLLVSNNRQGTAHLADCLAEAARRGNFASIHIAAEATGAYWLPFFCQLQQEPRLAAWPLTLYPFNPRVVHNFRKAFVDLDKVDLNDAHLVAERLRFGRNLPAPFAMEEQFLPLRSLTRYRFHLVHELVRVKSYCTYLVYLKSSEYTADRDWQPFSDIFGATSRAVLRDFPSMDAIIEMPFDELVEWLDVKGKRRFADPEANARKLVRVAEDSYRLPAPWLESVNIILGLNLRHLKTLENLIQRVDTAIADEMKAIPNTLTTIPGIGPVIAAGIIAELGDLARFDYDQKKVASYAGLKWSRRQSGDFLAEETTLKRQGNRFLRYYFCEAAHLVRMNDAEYNAFYTKKYNEALKHKHKRAIVLTARKLVRLVVRLLTTNQPFRVRRVDSDESV